MLFGKVMELCLCWRKRDTRSRPWGYTAQPHFLILLLCLPHQVTIKPSGPLHPCKLFPKLLLIVVFSHNPSTVTITLLRTPLRQLSLRLGLGHACLWQLWKLDTRWEVLAPLEPRIHPSQRLGEEQLTCPSAAPAVPLWVPLALVVLHWRKLSGATVSDEGN